LGLVKEKSKAVISETKAGRIAAEYTGGEVTSVSYSRSYNGSSYRVRTVTKNSGKTYDTRIDARTGKVMFSDEIWWLMELF